MNKPSYLPAKNRFAPRLKSRVLQENPIFFAGLNGAWLESRHPQSPKPFGVLAAWRVRVRRGKASSQTGYVHLHLEGMECPGGPVAALEVTDDVSHLARLRQRSWG